MRIGILHGYELTGSGSNEYCRYLSSALAGAGHEVHVYCREPKPETIQHVTRAFAWDAQGGAEQLFDRGDAESSCTLHQLPHGEVRPVFLTDKQRSGNVKAFCDLDDDELRAYHELGVGVLRSIFARFEVDVVHANHVVWQPQLMAELEQPYVVFPHGSAIEYTLRKDQRYRDAALDALVSASGWIVGSEEVRQRILDLYPEHAESLNARHRIVGVGVDTELFQPIGRSERRASIAKLRGIGGGKSPHQRKALAERLDRGDFAAVRDYYDAYDHGKPDGDAVERLLELPWESGRVLLFVGALTAGKGLQDIIAALPQTFAESADVHLVIVGSGAYREVLEAQVHALATGNKELLAWLIENGFDLDRSDLSGAWPGHDAEVKACPQLADRVHFVGRMQHNELRRLFPCADHAVFPSVVPEAYPLVLMESLANGVPPLVSDFSGFADGLNNLEQHLDRAIVDRMRLPTGEDRVAQLSSRLTAALAHELSDQDRQELRNVAVERYDWRVRADEIVAAFESILSESASMPLHAPS